MMETIIGWLYKVIGEVLNVIIKLFLNSLELSLGQFVQIFPVVVTFYKMFRVLGIGLIILISCYQLFKFFAGPLSESKDTPGRILMRSGIAAFLVFFGGYFINWIVDIAKVPYDAFIKVDPVGGALFGTYDLTAGINDILTVMGSELTAFSVPAQLAFSFLLAIVIGWNLLKLIIEVAERFLMVGVLAYVAPLTFATLASQATSMIFGRYLQMFAGQCILMTLSVWSLKVVLSGLGSIASAGVAWPVAMILILAFCRIAQRLDSYMQQLGIGVGTTGGSLLDELCNMARTAAALGHSGGGGRERGSNNSDSVLGGATDSSGNVTPMASNGLLNGVKGAWNKGKEAFTSGKSAGEVVAAAGSGFGDGAAGAFKGADGKYHLGSSAGKIAAATIGGKGLVNALNQREAAKMGITKEAAGTAHKNSEGKPVLDDRARANGLNINDKNDGPVLNGSIPSMRDYIAANAGDANQKDLLQNSLAKGSPLVAEGVLDGPNAFEPGKDGNSAQDDVLASAMHSAFGSGDISDDPANENNQKRMEDLQKAANDQNLPKEEREQAAKELAGMQTAMGNVSQVRSAMAGSIGGNHENGYLKDVSVQNMPNGGRQISAAVKDSGGRSMGAMTMLNEQGYKGLSDAQRDGFVPVTSATGATWYMKADGGATVSDMSAGSVGSSSVKPLASPCAVDSSGDYPVYSDSERGYVNETVAQKFQSKDAGEVVTAANTVAADSFTSDDASAVMDSWENSGATINPKNVSATDDAPAVSSAYASEAAPSQQAASAIMGVTQKAFGGSEAFVEQVGAAFGNTPSEGFNPEHAKEAFDNFGKGKTSNAFTISKVSVHNGQTQFTMHYGDESHKMETCRDDSGKRSVKILESYGRNDHTKPHSGGEAGPGNNPKKRK